MSDIKGMNVPRISKSLEPATSRQRQMLVSMDRFNTFDAARQYSGGVIRSTMTRSGYIAHRSQYGRNSTWAIRPPTPLEQESAISTAKRLEKIEVRGAARSKSWSNDPSGKMNGSRYRKHKMTIRAGRVPTTKMFAKTKVQESPRTKVKVGILLDSSASMGTHCELGSSLAWVLAEATRRISGDVATVTVSNQVWPLVAPGESQSGVIVTGTSAGGHRIDDAVLALDAALNLVDGDGARLLVVFADGQFPHDRTETLPLMGESGVQVLWVGPGDAIEPKITRPRQFFSQCEVQDSDTYTDVLESIVSALESAVLRDKRLKGATL